LALLFGLTHAALLAPSVASAQASDAFKGKEIRLLVGQPAGGGYDLYARLFAKFLPRFLAGGPVVISQNMPGAGSILMANFIYAQAAADGTVLGMGGGTIATAGLFAFPGAKFDSRRFSWIGSMNSEIGVAVSWRPSKVNSAQDLFTEDLLVGGAGATSNSVIFPNALNKILETRFKVIPGYKGSADSALAMERGEVQGIGAWNYSSIASSRPDWIAEHKLNFLLQVSLTKHPSLPTVPTVLELSRDAEQRQLLSLILAQQRIGRPILAPPAVPSDRLADLRSAFLAMMVDSEFKQEAEKLGVEIVEPMSGDDISRLLSELYSAPPDLISKASAALASNDK
jgi:tripartite-type tricarboxylate transporter receptor subunit TctC